VTDEATVLAYSDALNRLFSLAGDERAQASERSTGQRPETASSKVRTR
jgi:hypothetical protein